jgi:hypothetical protein
LFLHILPILKNLSMMKKLKIITIGFLVLFNISAKAQETKFIALYLYNFTKYIDWPEEQKKGEFIIGVVGSNQVHAELLQLAQGKPVGTQIISVKNFRSIDEVSGCHILFLSESQSRRVDQAVSKLAQSSPLIVTQMEGATLFGSAINFVIRDETMKFELKKTNAIKYGLRVHSRLDNLAIVID